MADTYLAELKRDAVATAAGSRSYDSGAESIEIVFDLAEPLPTGDKTIVGQLWLTERSLERTKDTLKAVGVNPDSSQYENENDLYRAIEGKAFRLVVALEAANKFHSEDRWIVRYINGPKVEAKGSVLSRLRGAQQTLPIGKDDDETDAPF